MYLDAVSTAQILKLRDLFGVTYFVETGTAEGNNAIFYSRLFHHVVSMEIDPVLLERARFRTKDISNIWLWPGYSGHGLAFFKECYEKRWRRVSEGRSPIFFLDAHSGAKETWPILDELHALRGFHDCCIIIHDFKVDGLGHLNYDGQSLDLAYVQKSLNAVNPDFCLYTNFPGATQPRTFDELVKICGMPNEFDLKHMVDYAWSSERRLRRGILYAVPKPLDDTFNLRRLQWSLD